MNKRGNNEGSIYKRKDGRYAGAVSLDNGKRKTVYGATREEAAAKLTAIQTTKQLGIPMPDDRLTVRRFLEAWLENTARPSVRSSTFESYSDYVNLHLIPGLGRHRLTKLSPQIVDTFLAERLKSGLSPRTVNHIRAILRTALNKALSWGIVHRNAAALADPRRVTEPDRVVLSPEQGTALLEGVRDDRLCALYTIALTLGLRLGECLGLQWVDIDFEKGSLRVRQALQRSGGSAIFVEPKSKNSRRRVTLPALTLTALRDHRTRQLEERLKAGAEWHDGNLVFCTVHGDPLNPSSTTRRLRTILTQLKLPQMRFHDLRHSTASLLLAKGVHPRLVMELLGHSQISLTMNTYSHVIPALQREVADQMDSLFAASS